MKSLAQYIIEATENTDLNFMANIEHKLKTNKVKINFTNQDASEIEKKYKNDFKEEVVSENPSYGIVYSGAKTCGKLVWTKISNKSETEDVELCDIPTKDLVTIIKKNFEFKDGELVRKQQKLNI